MELSFQGARFYEVLGYFLTVSAFGILAGGVVWRLSRHVPATRRTLFRVGSTAAIVVTSLCVFAILVWSSVPISPGALSLPQKRIKTLEDVEPVGGGVQMIRVHVSPNGAVIFRDREWTVEDLVAEHRQSDPGDRLNVTIHTADETTVGQLQNIIQQLQDNGVERFSVVHDD